uniref:3-dehydrosphinganine reductase n=1 Tax=Saccoglossus kowalevskii TaxID=10224 RepID=A0ABM0MUE1_SACKO|nr:PREDICTED: 3-ketodihydrosphingosine reductase-like [Saccoglossus kowalevskii]
MAVTANIKTEMSDITGGSSGIGKALAIEAVKEGANVTIIARNQKVLSFSLDICKDYKAVEEVMKQERLRQSKEEICEHLRYPDEQAIDDGGPCGMLINCAGMAVAKSFADIDVAEFKNIMDVNVLGSVYATRAVLPFMKQRKQGRIVFISSQAGQIGLYGYTAYCASKFALRGFAEALQMEVKPYDIYITVSFPPDTDTPGFQAENISKPKETTLISETAGLFQPEDVAKVIINDASLGRFLSYIGVDGYMLSNVTCGFSPVTSMMEGVQQVATMGFFRIISFFYIGHFDKIIKKCMEERESEKDK